MKARALIPFVLLAGAPPSRAGAARIAVVPLSAPPELMFTGKSVALTIAAEAGQEGGTEVVGPDAVEQQLGREGAETLIRCADDTKCLAARASALGADRVIGGWISKVGDSYRLVIVQADAKTGGRVARVEREIPIASRRLRADVATAAPVLLRGEGEGKGVLVVQSDVAGADVAIDGAPAGTAPVKRELRPGKHKVQVTKLGYVVQEPFWVEVPAKGEVTQQVKLHEIPARDRPAGGTKVQVVK